MQTALFHSYQRGRERPLHNRDHQTSDVCIRGIRTVSGTISTESRAKMLFLTIIKGHNLCFRVRRPRVLVAGVILYQTTWVLLPGGA